MAQRYPGIVKAFLAAQEEATAYIAAGREGAASAYTKGTQLKTPKAELLEMLADPENSDSPVPNGSPIYAGFMAQTGVLKAKPAAWTGLFLPSLHGRDGS